MKHRICRGLNYLDNSMVQTANGWYSHQHTESEINALVAFGQTHSYGYKKPTNEDLAEMIVGETAIASEKLLDKILNGKG